MKQFQQKQSQSGRSMVEMLGVLAIIGVLSVGGITGYRYAMNQYEKNEFFNQMNILLLERRIMTDHDGYFCEMGEENNSLQTYQQNYLQKDENTFSKVPGVVRVSDLYGGCNSSYEIGLKIKKEFFTIDFIDQLYTFIDSKLVDDLSWNGFSFKYGETQDLEFIIKNNYIVDDEEIKFVIKE